MVVELGDIDGKQMWWCDECKAVAPAVKRNKAPDVKHADDCGKSKKAGIVVELEAGKVDAPAVVVHPLDSLTPPDASEK